MPEQSKGKDSAPDPAKDRFPKLQSVVTRLLDSEDMPAGAVERVEIYCLANGEANVRVWAAKAEEPEVLFLAEER